MAARVKKRTDTSTNRESDKIFVRLPAGMRKHLAQVAARRGKSMNAEVVTALAIHIARDGEPDETTIKSELAELKEGIKLSEEGLIQMSKRLQAGVTGLENLFFDVRDVDLDAFISDQRGQGVGLTRTEAIRKILRSYLHERGYGPGNKKTPGS
ncbi:Arc family DNA-binding protein [Bradyrhizobium sp. CSA112]|uniref:Arc family DNA-binding protein n=1 Tax=Bradyrhizobium sp. CSA112 TaxID=2699170 RepID=UPI0023B0DB4B|nr:Arc family DNA-binding protein [Bradyrhizobium sp. CSA112]MDE5454024.1 Arc family DNA-binding protein [Bradyrhizobium sp. CSA112]